MWTIPIALSALIAVASANMSGIHSVWAIGLSIYLALIGLILHRHKYRKGE